MNNYISEMPSFPKLVRLQCLCSHTIDNWMFALIFILETI